VAVKGQADVYSVGGRQGQQTIRELRSTPFAIVAKGEKKDEAGLPP
jgi:hypothetical protein